jgi:hypothetical protein
VGFQLAALGPIVGLVVVIHIAQQEASGRFVNDQPDVGTHPHRPEILVLRPVQLVEAHAVACGIHLQVESGRLGRLLLVAGQAGETVGEGVGDEEGHSLTSSVLLMRVSLNWASFPKREDQ